MAGLSLKHIYKVYPGRNGSKLKKNKKDESSNTRVGDFVAVKDFSMEIEDGEFIVFVGPSGCGKSTTLRMIAGLEDITSGELSIGDKIVNEVDAKDRDIAMVFQNYALYPHMTSYQNIAFGLKIRKIPVPKVIKKVDSEGNEAVTPVIEIDNKKIKELQKKLKNLESDLRFQEECDVSELFIIRIAELEKELETEKAAEQVNEASVTGINEKIKALKLAQKTAIKAHRKPTEELKAQAAQQAEEVGVDITNIADNEIKVGLRQRIKSTEEEIKYYSEMPVQIYVYKHMPKAEIDKRVKWAAKILGIEELLDSRPAEMSGGQRQRIALGRAIVREPKVMLLDEPLSNLDAKLRTSMRSEIVRLHNELKTTFIYVTHDQIEAMTMGTRIVVMKLGVVQQIDTPTNLFDYPDNKFVAGFIGTPQMNFFDVKIKKSGDNLVTTYSNGQTVNYSLKKLRTINKELLDGEEHEVTIGIRGTNITLSDKGIATKLSIKEILGDTTQLFVKLSDDGSDIIVCLSERNDYVAGDTVKITFDEKHIHMFDKETELSVMSREYGN